MDEQDQLRPRLAIFLQTPTVTILSEPLGHVVHTIQTGTVFIGKSINLCYRVVTGPTVRSPGSNDDI